MNPSPRKTKRERPLPRCCPGGSGPIPDPPEKGTAKIYQGHASDRYIERLRAQVELDMLTENEGPLWSPQGRFNATSPRKGQLRGQFGMGSPKLYQDPDKGRQTDRWLNEIPSRSSVSTAGYTHRGTRLPARSPNKRFSIASISSPPISPKTPTVSAFSFPQSPKRGIPPTGRLLSPEPSARFASPMRKSKTPNPELSLSSNMENEYSTSVASTAGSRAKRYPEYPAPNSWRLNYVDVVLDDKPKTPSYERFRTAASITDYAKLSGAISCEEDATHLPVELRALSPERRHKIIEANNMRKLYNKGWDPRTTKPGLFGSYGLTPL